ncbi:aspartate-semialdehyde dehydrogenase [bacterium]|nr:aspartate-semialdehyde dehydrogenase [bacterium]
MNTDKPIIVILGASGLVGQTLISILNQREFPRDELRLCSSPGGDGKQLAIDGKTYSTMPFEESVFDGADIVFFSGPDDLAPQYAPMAINKGAVVIDNSAHFRMKPSVPLIVPEVNAHAISKHSGIIANPNCTTSGLVCALAPIREKLGLEWVSAASYQAISGAGLKQKNDFIAGTKKAIEDNFQNPDPYELPFNLIPAVGSYTGVQNFSEEERLINETRKILEQPTLKIYPTCVRVPVINAHSIAVTFKTSENFKEGELEYILNNADGVRIVDDLTNRRFPTPVSADGIDDVLVGRIRRFEENIGGMWVVADNLRKGAALNSIQIAEILLKHEREKNG